MSCKSTWSSLASNHKWKHLCSFSLILKMCGGSHTLLNLLIHQEIILLYLGCQWTTKTVLVLQQNQNIAWAYSEPNQSSKMERFAKIVYDFQLTTIFARCSILDVRLSFECIHDIIIRLYKQTNKPLISRLITFRKMFTIFTAIIFTPYHIFAFFLSMKGYLFWFTVWLTQLSIPSSSGGRIQITIKLTTVNILG